MRPLLPLTALALLAAAPPAAAAPVLNPLKLCYVTVQTGPETIDTEPIAVSGSGFTPSAIVDVFADEEVVASGIQAAPDGTLPAGTVPSPPILEGQRPFELSVAERDNPAQTAAAEARVSALKVTVTPRRARPDAQVRFRGRGFTERGAIYAHYVRRGRLRKTVMLAPAPSGACGTFDVRRRQFPFKPKMGTWNLQIDQSRRLGDDGPLINLTIDVRRRPRTR